MTAESGSSDTELNALHQEHPLNRAARDGFGPLSAQSSQVWHGHGIPCVSCAQLVRRDAETCRHCGQDLSSEMLARMARHSGPWYVYDPIRPFPGVSLERIDRQIKRGVLNATSIIKGPTTSSQWRFAVETPLIARLLGRCWNCHRKISDAERYCPACKEPVDGHLGDTEPQNAPPTAALRELGRALHDHPPAPTVPRVQQAERPLGRTILVFLVIAAVVIAGLVVLADRSQDPAGGAVQPAPPATSGNPA